MERKAGREIVDEHKLQATEIKKIRDEEEEDTKKKAKGLRENLRRSFAETSKIMRGPAPKWMNLQSMFKSIGGDKGDDTQEKLRKLSAERQEMVKKILALDEKRNMTLEAIGKTLLRPVGAALGVRL